MVAPSVVNLQFQVHYLHQVLILSSMDHVKVDVKHNLDSATSYSFQSFYPNQRGEEDQFQCNLPA